MATAESDLLVSTRRDIGDRLKELKPLVDEYYRLEAAVAALDGVKQLHSEGRSRRATSPKPSGPRRGRPKGSGTRGDQAVEMVRNRPGITIPEIAELMGIKQNYLYSLMPGLEGEGRVHKVGRGWFPAQNAV